MSEDPAVLFSNDAFYTVFLTRDYDAMEGLWSKRPTITCIHPGWPPLSGREEVMRSWHGILTGPNAPEITCHHARSHVCGDVAYVICHEKLDTEFLVATNVFVHEDGIWKLVHHQAGAAPPPSLEDDEKPEPVQ